MRLTLVIGVFVLILGILLPVASAESNYMLSESHSGIAGGRISQASASKGQCTEVGGNNETSPIIIHCPVIPSDDTFVDNLIPTKAFGDLPVLIVQNVPSVPVSRNYAYLKFDGESAFPPQLVLSHAQPSNATLWMYVRFGSTLLTASIQVYRVLSNDWNERTLTWNTRPSLDLSEYSTVIFRTNGTWVHWNLTRIIGRALEESSQISLAAAPNATSWANLVWFDSKEYPYDNGLTIPRLDLTFVEPFLKIETPYPNLPIAVGENLFHTDANGKFQALVPWGQYQISVPEIVPQGNGTRAFFVGWSDHVAQANRLVTVGNNVTFHAEYKIQYRLDVNSPYGSTSGSGWYFEKSTTNVSVYPTAVPAESWAGWLGVRHVFDHWTGACITSQPACSVVMDGPKVTTAVWRDDYAISLSVLISLIIGGTITFIFLRRRRRPRRKSRQSRHKAKSRR